MNRILIIAPNWIGDAVMSEPLLAKLKTLYPQSTIEVLASQWVAPIYRSCAEVNEVIEADLAHKQLQWGLRKQLARQIQAKQYDACFVLPNSLKSAIIPWLAKVPLRIGYRGEMRYGFINRALDNPSKVNRPPMAQHYLALSKELYHNVTSTTDTSVEPRLQISAQASVAVSNKLSQSSIDPELIYIFCPGAEYGPTKRWPADHFASLTQSLLAAKPKAQIILLGSKKDHVLAQSIFVQAGSPPQMHNWCGNTSLDEAIALIGRSKALISNDSGLMHVAAALKIPQVAIFGSSDPHHTPPLSSKANILYLNLACSPCHKRECPLGHLKCLRDISPTMVLDSVTALH